MFNSYLEKVNYFKSTILEDAIFIFVTSFFSIFNFPSIYYFPKASINSIQLSSIYCGNLYFPYFNQSPLKQLLYLSGLYSFEAFRVLFFNQSNLRRFKSEIIISHYRFILISPFHDPYLFLFLFLCLDPFLFLFELQILILLEKVFINYIYSNQSLNFIVANLLCYLNWKEQLCSIQCPKNIPFTSSL